MDFFVSFYCKRNDEELFFLPLPSAKKKNRKYANTHQL